ncbi:MAG: hypothetical protein HFI75_07500 [Lachnospiraceae bacterium]|nr:hypothetical protein [Lachnospiraceae bacterium]
MMKVGKQTLIKKLKSNPTLDFIQKSIRFLSDRDYMKNAADYYRDPYNFFLRSLGNADRNKDKVVYYITQGGPYPGFCSMLMYLLLALEKMDIFHMYPVILWKDSLYGEIGEINGTSYAYEYYFNQPAGISVAEAENSANVLLSKPCDFSYRVGLNPYSLKEAEINQLAIQYKKYIMLKPEISQYLMNHINQIISGKRTLGVHIRGTDFNLGLHNHPVAVSPEEYVQMIEKRIKEYHYEQIFLATDDEAILEFMKKKLSHTIKVVYYHDVFRSKDGLPVHKSLDKRENHKYLLGLEILRDVYTLANCTGLLAGVSNVSICVRVINQTLGHRFEQTDIIDKGLCKSNLDLQTAFQKLPH